MDNGQNVADALELLIQEIDKFETELREECARAIRACEDRDAENLAAMIQRLGKFREKIEPLRAEWSQILRGGERRRRRQRRNTQRAPRGERTPVQSFREPILKALMKLGGKAKVKDVLAEVEKMMSSQLRHIDYEPLPSNPSILRWRNTAQWCRNSLVKEGLLAKNSPRCVWEITEKGRRSLEAMGMREK